MLEPGTLPLHPTMRHPRTGAPVRALYVRADGRTMWPIMGAAPDDPPAGDAAAAAAAAATAAAATAAAAEKAAADKAAADAAAAGAANDLGFPANTPVAEMKFAEQVAYHKHQARRHEERNKDILKITGGKSGDELKADMAELARLRTASLSDADKALEAAKNETRVATVSQMSADAAQVALEFALGHDPETNDQSALIGSLDLSKLVTDDGKVDAAKVRALVATIAPSVKGQGTQRHDFGAGNHGGQSSTGVASGRTRYQERHGKADKAGT